MNKPQRINELSPFNLENLAPLIAQLEGFDETGQPLLNVAGRTVTGKMVARLGFEARISGTKGKRPQSNRRVGADRAYH